MELKFSNKDFPVFEEFQNGVVIGTTKLDNAPIHLLLIGGNDLYLQYNDFPYFVDFIKKEDLDNSSFSNRISYLVNTVVNNVLKLDIDEVDISNVLIKDHLDNYVNDTKLTKEIDGETITFEKDFDHLTRKLIIGNDFGKYEFMIYDNVDLKKISDLFNENYNINDFMEEQKNNIYNVVVDVSDTNNRNKDHFYLTCESLGDYNFQKTIISDKEKLEVRRNTLTYSYDDKYIKIDFEKELINTNTPLFENKLHLYGDYFRSHFEDVGQVDLEDFDVNIEKPLEKEFKYKPSTKEELKELVHDNTIYLGDIDTSKIEDFSVLFNNSVRSDFSGLEYWNTSKVTNMAYVFTNCDFFNYDGIKTWDTSKVTNMEGMFNNCEKFNGKGVENWDISNVENTSGMFRRCFDFNADLSKWNTSKVETMEGMFYNCKSFEGIGVENFNTKNVTNMYGMFEYCENFNRNLSNFDVSKVTDIGYMFEGCKLFEGNGLEYWNVINVEKAYCTFEECRSLNVDLSNWKPNNLEYTNYMFAGCDNLNQDVKNWDLSKFDKGYMFGDSDPKTINEPNIKTKDELDM